MVEGWSNGRWYAEGSPQGESAGWQDDGVGVDWVCIGLGWGSGMAAEGRRSGGGERMLEKIFFLYIVFILYLCLCTFRGTKMLIIYK